MRSSSMRDRLWSQPVVHVQVANSVFIEVDQAVTGYFLSGEGSKVHARPRTQAYCQESNAFGTSPAWCPYSHSEGYALKMRQQES